MQTIIVMNGTAEEIAALALAVQERQTQRTEASASSCRFKTPSIREVEEFLNHRIQSVLDQEELLQWLQRKFDRST